MKHQGPYPQTQIALVKPEPSRKLYRSAAWERTASVASFFNDHASGS